MKDTAEATKAPEAEAVDPAKEKDALILADIKQNTVLLGRGVSSNEVRYSLRVLRTLAPTRKRLNASVLHQALAAHLPPGHGLIAFLTKYIGEAPSASMEVDGPAAKQKKTPASLVEVEAYLQLLVVIWLLDNTRVNDAIECADDLVSRMEQHNRRTLYSLAAKAWFYRARAYEVAGRFPELRKELLAALRTATLRRDDDGQATVVCLLLRNYLESDLYEQAQLLVSKSSFPENASNNEWARYLYYLGRISAIKLDYASAHKQLEQALRKAPQGSAAGFQQTAYKFLVIVQLLLGEIPDRAIFRRAMLRRALLPYRDLTQAVRRGDLVSFNETIEKNAAKFQADKTYLLILRLRHNVIKTGVRMICLSYSRISLADICAKLHLDSPEDAEYIVAKAIRDGVISATIDHSNGWVQSKESADVYNTSEPQDQFHQRIQFCINVYNESVKALRFPPNEYRKSLESEEERRLREQQELELVEIGDDEDDEF